MTALSKLLPALWIAIAAQAQAPAKPWPGQNPNGGPPAAAPAPATPNPAQNGQPITYEKLKQQQQQQQNAAPASSAPSMPPGFDREIVGGGDSGGPVGRAGVSNSLDIGGSAGSKYGVSMVSVRGCTNVPGKVQFKYGKAGTPGCDGNLKMAEQLANFIDRNFNRCAKQAAGINGSLEGIKIYHDGCIGDAAHQQTGSLHNLGLALDVNAIEIGGTIYDFRNSAHQAFYERFRQCWGEAANSERGGCLTSNGRGKAPGTIGQEDSKHAGHHMHLSLPLCPQEARARGLYMAIQWLFGEPAGAQEAEPKLGEPSTVKTRQLKMKNGEIQVTVEDTHGEPVGADQRISVRVKCAGDQEPRVLEKEIESCSFTTAKYSEKAGVLTVFYLTSEMNKEGELSCRVRRSKKIQVKCGSAAK